jgi:hypothetical protein
MKYLVLLKYLPWDQIWWIGLGVWYFFKKDCGAGIGCLVMAQLLRNEDMAKQREIYFFKQTHKLPWVK